MGRCGAPDIFGNLQSQDLKTEAAGGRGLRNAPGPTSGASGGGMPVFLPSLPSPALLPCSFFPPSLLPSFYPACPRCWNRKV